MQALRRRDASSLICSLLAAALLSANADFLFKDFSTVAGLNLQAATNRTVNRLRLTPALTGVVGSAWYAPLCEVYMYDE